MTSLEYCLLVITHLKTLRCLVAVLLRIRGSFEVNTYLNCKLLEKEVSSTHSKCPPAHPIASPAKIPFQNLLDNQIQILIYKIGNHYIISNNSEISLNEENIVYYQWQNYTFRRQFNSIQNESYAMFIIKCHKIEQINQYLPQEQLYLLYDLYLIIPMFTLLQNQYIMMQNTHIYKIVVLGQCKTFANIARVGKSSIAVRFVQDTFDIDKPSTIDATYLQKYLEIEQGIQVKLTIWDTAGQQKYHAIVPVYYRDANGAIIVYEVTYKQSFEKAQQWIKQLHEFAPKDIVIFLIANKIDLQNEREVQKQEAEKFCHQHGITYFEVSAKIGYNIKPMFQQLAKQLYHTQHDTESTHNRKKKHSRKIDLIHSQHIHQEQKKKCC